MITMDKITALRGQGVVYLCSRYRERHCVRADDNKQEHVVEDAGKGRMLGSGAAAALEATEQLLRDSEGSTTSLYGV